MLKALADRAEKVGETLQRVRLNAALVKYLVPRTARRVERARFVLFGLMRSGTSLFGDLLGCHPDLTWFGETRIHGAYFPIRYLSAVAGSSPTVCVGFKVFSFQLSPNTDPAKNYNHSDIEGGRRILRKLRDNGWKFLHVSRADSFAQAVSLTRAQQTGVWHRYDGDSKSPRKIRLDPDKFKDNLGFLMRCRAYEAAIFSGLEVLQFNYEADLRDRSNHQATAERAFAYLGLSALPVASNFVKLGDGPFEDLVTNCDELTFAAASLGVDRAEAA